MSKRNVAIAVVVLIIVGGLLFFLEPSHKERLILATTTSTYDSGLLDTLVPAFERKHLLQVEVQIVSVGTGQALAMGRSGDCDVLLVHARASEDQFVADGYGVLRCCVMYNDFVVVGPVTDPADISSAINAIDAFRKIAVAGEKGEAVFVSRGDNSGTNKKELAVWGSAGIDPTGKSWYKEVGTGMGNTLTITSEMQAYTLTDRGTWISKRDTLSLKILSEGDAILLNPYGVMAINPKKHPNVNLNMAKAFIYFLISPEGQEMINEFL
ncbi:MAG: substrate-binding domain-containing protein, partial [Candidatus Bathyarchaeota archaeon]